MRKKKSGFTLIELIISSSLLVLVTLILFTAFNTSITIINFSNNKSALQTECQNIEEVLGEIGRQASSITSEGESSYNVTLKVLNDKGTNENYIIVYEDNKLTINNKEYSKNVKSFSISQNGNLVDINMVLEKGYYKSKVTYPVKSSILLRNK